jgi:nucleosome binding factor SPN SPT16 subunit
MRFLSIRIQRGFIKEKLNISFGINNILQSPFINNDIYRLTEIDREIIENERVISGYPRSFTFKVTYTNP